MLSFTYIFILSLAVEMVKRGDESLEERYQLFVRRKEIVLEEMRQLEKQLETIDHKLWYYETAIKAGTEDIHKKYSSRYREDFLYGVILLLFL